MGRIKNNEEPRILDIPHSYWCKALGVDRATLVEIRTKIVARYNIALKKPDGISAEWLGEFGRESYIRHALALVSTEYRPGFVVGSALVDSETRILSKENLMWYSNRLAKFLNYRCARRDRTRLYGTSRCGIYYTSALGRDITVYYKTELEAHQAYVKSKLETAEEFLETLAPRPRAVLEARIERVRKELATNGFITRL